MRILIVDDNPLDLLVLEKFLEETISVVSKANSSALALDFLKLSRFDLLITDYDMPGMRGDELAAEARAVHPSIQIWCVTASLEDDEFGRCSELCDLVMHKPLQYSLFREAFMGLR